MKLNHLVSTLIGAGLLLNVTASHADGLRFLPGLEKGFKFEPTVAATIGAMNTPSANDDVVAMYGIDFNMNCGLIQTPDNRIRTHVQLNFTNDSGVKTASFELSPRYTLPLGNSFSVGAGPVLGALHNDRTNDTHFAYGAVIGANYRMGMAYVGLDLRYLNTTEQRGVSFESTALQAKFGINF